MSEQITLFDVDNKPTPKFKSLYQKWKYQNNYRKADNKNQCCKNCVYLSKIIPSKRIYYKCWMIGLSGSSATDVRLSCVCDLFEGM